MQRILYILLFLSVLLQCRREEPDYITQFSGKPEVPHFIKQEHGYLLGELEKLTLTKDSTGRVAARTMKFMHHHFQEEEDYVLPPLQTLPSLASEIIPEHSAEIIRLTEKLRSQLTHMNAEHQMIMALLEELKQAAAYDNHPDITWLEEQINRHAKAEEEVFFPAAIVIGEYLKQKGVK